MPPAARSPSIRGDRPGNAEREHLGRRQQRGLTARVDDPSIARNATSVLPDPTSPWSSRCIGRLRPSSAMISSLTAI